MRASSARFLKYRYAHSGYTPPQPEDGTQPVDQMMREYARNNGGLWPYFRK